MNELSLSDRELVAKYKGGSESAFEELVLRHKNALYSMIYMVTKDTYVAEDILQETFIKAIHTIRSGKYREKERFHYWLQRVGYNLAVDYFRKQKRTPVVHEKEETETIQQIPHTEPNQEAICVKQDGRRELHRIIRELPEAQRQVLVMRTYLKMSFQSIAEEMGTSVNTALGRMRYALIGLRKRMCDKKNRLNT